MAECNDAGTGSELLICNRAHLPHEMFLNQLRRIGREVLASPATPGDRGCACPGQHRDLKLHRGETS